jgi:anaerobic selenocysteine-containing dehydrogenase
MVDDDGRPAYPGGFADYMVNHQRRPGIGMLAGWRGPNGGSSGRGAPNPGQLQRYIEHDCFWHEDMPRAARYFKHANKDYLDYAVAMGFLDRAEPVVLQLYLEPLQKFRLAAEGHGKVVPPPEHRERIRRYFDPLPIWYRPFEEAAVGGDDFPLHAVTQRPMIMYHAWDSQNAWLRQIISQNRLYVSRQFAERHGIADDQWVWIESHHGRIKGQVRLMAGVNPDTVWTWNAIAKRSGAWNLDPAAPEATRGFLLNHVIAELLPEQAGGYRYANCDPVTGQAAWYDLRVRLRPCAPQEIGAAATAPPLPVPPGLPKRPRKLRYGAWFRDAERAP